jgi:oligopeptide/dipeptide ABC transporter ATP-binding protein
MPTLLSAPQHPYTRALLASIPRLRRNDKTAPTRGANWSPPKLSVLPDADEGADDTAKGCGFAARCPTRRAAPEQFPRCLIDAPGLDPPLAKHRARCFYPQLDTLRNA